jgi:tRNA (mo5U34)-methyltransferase
LAGTSVLDIGAWDGFFSFEAERRGASRVLATDSFIWGGANPHQSRAGFDLARRALGSHVEDCTIDVMDLSPETVGVFDLVLFLGVLYHLKHPLLALERVYSVTADHLVLETHAERRPARRPAMVLYPGAELAGDPTNWWGPNVAAVEGMLTTVGFSRVRVVSRRRAGRRVRDRLAYERVVLHAWR